MKESDKNNSTGVKSLVNYRKAALEDIPILTKYRLQFLKEVQGNSSLKIRRTLENELNNYFRRAIRENTFISWIAEYAKQPVGFGSMVIQHIPGNLEIPNGRTGYILNMYTLPEYRGIGISTEILERLILDGQREGLNKVYLHATPDGIGIYRKKGFREPYFPVLEYIFNK
jgi:GNAT superfamily N-acetyltransferase